MAASGSLMVQGTSSWAGKSLLTTVLCRHFARRGVRVAPFKAQNMSNNARVVSGGEIGVAQYLQARAARVEPDVRMNPVLVKPHTHTSSQVVLAGVVSEEITALGWRERAPRLWPTVERSLRSLMEEFELIVIEGAGSPAEINLESSDMSNLRTGEMTRAPVLLVSDIDRGGAFAHLYGTWALVPQETRERIAGFVLNKFRGDAALLAPAPEELERLTGVPTLGVVPWLHHGLPDEDGAAHPRPREGGQRVAIVCYPTASNLDEYKLLEEVAQVRWARVPDEIASADLVVLPGSKHVAADLDWLRGGGWAAPLRARVAAGGRVLGVCGGLQMLGRRLREDGAGERDGEGLGLLPLSTVFEREKLTRRVEVRFGADLGDVWAPLAGIAVSGYEIRHGRTRAEEPGGVALTDDRGWVRGAVLALSVHGVLESPDVLEALFGARPEHTLEEVIDNVTDGAVAGLDIERIEELALGC